MTGELLTTIPADRRGEPNIDYNELHVVLSARLITPTGTIGLDTGRAGIIWCCWGHPSDMSLDVMVIRRIGD